MIALVYTFKLNITDGGMLYLINIYFVKYLITLVLFSWEYYNIVRNI